MNFANTELTMLAVALHTELFWIRNEIVTCPDPDEPEYAAKLVELHRDQDEFSALLAKVEKEIK